MHTRFEIEPDYADALRAAGLADFDALFKATPSGPPTSKHRHRETVPIEFDLNGMRQRFFLKRVFKVPGQHSWRPWLRGKPGYSQPAREWDNIKMMREAGLPVMKRVAVGERRKFGIPMQAFILVEDVGMQWTLENWLIPGFPKPPSAERIDTRQLWYELGNIRRKFNQAKIMWPDIHAKHIFAQPIISQSKHVEEWQIALIDLERAYHAPDSPAIDWDKAEFLSSDEMKRIFPVDKPVRLKKANIRDVDWNPLLTSLFPRWLSNDEHTAFINGESGRPWDERRSEPDDHFPWLRGHFEPLPLADSYIHPRAECTDWQCGIKASGRARALLAGIGITNVESAFQLSDVQRLDKPGLQKHRDRLRLTTVNECGSKLVLFVKRYRRPPLREQFTRMLTPGSEHSTSYCEFESARGLMQLGIPTMNAIAMGEEMYGPWERRSFVVTMAVEGDSLETLARNWKANPKSAPSVRDRWEIIERVAHLVARMHSSGKFHRDLYLSHIFLTRNSKRELVAQVIDLGRMLHGPRWTRRWQIKDLAALSYSVPTGLLTRTDHLRFLRAQGLGHFVRTSESSRNNPTRILWREHLLSLIRSINRRADKMARHDAKRAARLGIHKEKTDRPLAGSTKTQTAHTPVE